MKKLYAIIPALLLVMNLHAQTPPALSAIKEADLKKDIFDIASDAFRGRRAGTIDEFRAAAWVAQKAQEAGLKPAGEDGTYFQYFNIHRTRIGGNGTFTLNGAPLKLWKQVWPTQSQEVHINGPVTWLKSMADTAADLRGKIVAVKLVAPNPLPAASMSLWGFRYTSSAVRAQSAALRRKGIAALIIVADEVTEGSMPFIGFNYESGQYAVDGAPMRAAAPNAGATNRGNNRVAAAATAQLPVILVRQSMATVLQANPVIKADFEVEHFDYPSVNVIAKVAGTDPKLRDEYVLFSGHHDHDGVGNPVGQDSIWNGADDNASVTVGMLAVGRAWVAKPGKRSALFVWHGAEERGLLGSRWYVAHPTVDKNAIVAVLNGDMIGRNSVDSAALLGTTSHKNSTALVDMAMKANANLTHFKVDFSWDDARHPEGWYFRSDHAPYAAAGIPSIFFTSLLHPDYHTPKDEPDRINLPKLTKMTQWLYATGWLVSQTAERPGLDKK